MPCRDYPTDDTPYEKNLKERCDYLARIACTFAEQLRCSVAQTYTTADASEIDNCVRQYVGEEAYQWWKQHQKDDAQAAKNAKLKRAVIEQEYERDKERRAEALKAYKAAQQALGTSKLEILNVRPPAKIRSLNARLRDAGLPTDNG